MRVPGTTATRYLLAALALSCFLFLINLGGTDLWAPDEPRYAQVSKEMIDSGEYILPHLNNQVYSEKPPLFFWAIVLTSKVTGTVDSFSARFPAAVAGIATVALCFLLARRMFDPVTALLAAVILATNAEFLWRSRSAQIDTTLTLCTTAAIVAFYFWLNDRDGRRWPKLVAFYLFTVLAVLTKGPVGVIIPFLVALSFLFITRDREGRRAMHPIIGLVAGLALVLIWLVPAYLRGQGEYASTSILLKQTIGRFFGGYTHGRPIYYFFYKLPGALMPWALFLPLAIARGTKKANRSRDTLFLEVWTISVFIFFTLCKGKRTQYLDPILPAMAIYMANAIVATIRESGSLRSTRLLSYPIYIVGGAMIVFGVGGPLVLLSPVREYVEPAPVFLYSLAFVVTGAAILFSARKNLPVRTFASITAVAVVATALMAFYTNPRINQAKSVRGFCKPVADYVTDRPAKLLFYDLFRAQFILYSGTFGEIAETPQDVLDAGAGDEKVFFIMNEEHLDTFKAIPEFDRTFKLVHARQVGHRPLVLFTNSP